MAKLKPIPTCGIADCFENCYKKTDRNSIRWDRFCVKHKTKATTSRFLGNLYTRMKMRVKGKNTKNPQLYLGLPVLPKDIFMTWAKNHPGFLGLYKRWVSNNFDRKLTPSVNRINSSKGYTLDNIEWVTNSQNSGLSSVVRDMKKKKAIYELLGVNS